MHPILRNVLVGFSILSLVAACVAVPETKSDAPAPAASAPAPSLSVETQAAPPMTAPAAGASLAPAAQKAKSAHAPERPLTVEEQQARRETEKNLDYAVLDFYKLVADRNVDEALTYAIEAWREPLRAQLWALNNAYKLSSVDIATKHIAWEGLPEAEVTMTLSVYEKGSVTPIRKEMTDRWRLAGDRWFLIPPK